NLFYFTSFRGSDAYVEMSNGLFNTLQSNDIRRSVLLSVSNSTVEGVNDPDNILAIGKYPGSGTGELVNDVKVIRSAEMQLIIAESWARENNVGQAENAINTLRTKRGLSTVSLSSQQDALLEVLKQRRLELAYEGFRFIDLKRFRDVTNTGITRNSIDCASYHSVNCSLSGNDHRWVLPIPQAEINGNSKMTQNDGY